MGERQLKVAMNPKIAIAKNLDPDVIGFVCSSKKKLKKLSRKICTEMNDEYSY